jgi:hypothetical protein
MKHLFLFSFFFFALNANAQNCVGPIGPRVFQTELQQLRSNPNDASRLRNAMQVFLPYCLNSGQVYQVCRAFGTDPFRIDFAYAAYPNVVDPTNFYDVYDALDQKSSAFRLHDMILGELVIVPIPVEPTPVPDPAIPLCEVSPADVQEIKALVKAASFKDSMEKQAKMMIKSKHCFRVDQIIDLLGVFSYDDSKLMVAKFAYDYCIDTQNYYRVVNSFSFKSYQDDLTKFIGEKN